MHQYQLQKYTGIKSRYRCPQCNHRNKTFKLYIDINTNQPIDSKVGKCDRIDKCGYHYTPKMWFAERGVSVWSHESVVKKQIKKDSGLRAIDSRLFERSLQAYNRNHLITYLSNALGPDATQALIDKYQIGTAKHWPGSTVFWQIDISGNIKAGKVMLYDPSTGKRVKHPFNHIAWAHSIIKLPNFNLQQCLFGEHLLAGNMLPVGIVESEKTAMIASVYMPWYIWLATGGLANLSAKMFSALHGRDVYLYPDVNAFDTWRVKAAALKRIANITVSNLLELAAGNEQRSEGFDLADYLLNR